MSRLTDRELVILELGHYRIASAIREAMNVIKRKGGDVTLIPEVVAELASIVITPTVDIEE